MTTKTTVDGAGSPDVPDVTGRLDAASPLRIWSVLLVIVLFTEMAPIQYTMVAASLQKIAPSFPEAGANITWTMIVFGLIGASASPLIGKMSDVWGKKRLLLICGIIFSVGCLISAVTTDWWIFLLGRCLQSAAVAAPVVAYGLIRDLMPRKLVPIGLGIMATGFGFSAALSPLLAGWLVDSYDWRAMFWFLFAFGAIMIPLVATIVPESKLRVREPIDFLGAALISIGAALILIYVDKGHDWGWAKPTTLAWLLVGLAMLVAFVLVEFRASTPIMDMQLLLNPRVSFLLVTALLTSCMIGVQGYAVAYMVQTPDSTVIEGSVLAGTLAKITELTGIQMPPEAVQVVLDPGYTYGDGLTLFEFALRIALMQGLLGMVFGLVAGLVSRRFGPWYPLVASVVILAGVAVAQAVLPHTWQVFAVTSAVFGIAFGLYYAAAPILMVEAVPQEQQGISVGMLGVMQSMGVAIGVAAVTAFVAANPLSATVTVAGQPPQTSPIPQIFGDRGYELGFWFALGTVAVALLIVAAMKHGRKPATGGTAY